MGKLTKKDILSKAFRSTQRSYYQKGSEQPFKVSRSKFNDFLVCKRCFYLDRVKGLKKPSMPGWALNTAVDELLKKELDYYRKLKKPHPIMKEYNLNFLPFEHEDMDKWREPRTGGISFIDQDTNLEIYGGVDDIWLDLEKEEIAGRNQKFFFTRDNGLSLYTTRDIAYHIEKFKKFDRALNILGEDHKLQSKLLGIALREINCKTPETLFYSFVNLPGGKMSTRAGRVVYLDDIMQQITDLAMEKLGEIEDKEKLSKQIGIGALRYNILKVQAEKGFTFNIEEALNLQGDSAPFAMYSHARAAAILRKFEDELPRPDLGNKLEDSEIKLLITLSKWPETVKKSVENLAIHYIPNYAHMLASDFNQFYRDCPVLGDSNEKFRINLVMCSKKILNESLSILGIEAPETM